MKTVIINLCGVYEMRLQLPAYRLAMLETNFRKLPRPLLWGPSDTALRTVQLVGIPCMRQSEPAGVHRQYTTGARRPDFDTHCLSRTIGSISRIQVSSVRFYIQYDTNLTPPPASLRTWSPRYGTIPVHLMSPLSDNQSHFQVISTVPCLLCRQR